MSSYARVRAAVFCPECRDWHSVWVWTVDGKLADGLALAPGQPGGGYWYRLEPREDLGAIDSLSVPVYRPAGEVGWGEITAVRRPEVFH